MSKILLVEDNEMNRDMLSRRLERKEFEVIIAVDGQAGVNMATSESPDLILMDLSLPVIDGWEATRRIKADPATQSIPVIALTAAHAVDQVIQAVQEEDETAAEEVITVKDEVRRIADEFLMRQYERIGIQDSGHLDLVRLEMEFLDKLRGIYNLCRRVA